MPLVTTTLEHALDLGAFKRVKCVGAIAWVSGNHVEYTRCICTRQMHTNVLPRICLHRLSFTMHCLLLTQ